MAYTWLVVPKKFVNKLLATPVVLVVSPTVLGPVLVSDSLSCVKMVHSKICQTVQPPNSVRVVSVSFHQPVHLHLQLLHQLRLPLAADHVSHSPLLVAIPVHVVRVVSVRVLVLIVAVSNKLSVNVAPVSVVVPTVGSVSAVTISPMVNV